MSTRLLHRHPLAFCCLGSILAHVVLAQAAGLFGVYDFAAAVNEPPAVTVELVQPRHDAKSAGETRTVTVAGEYPDGPAAPADADANEGDAELPSVAGAFHEARPEPPVPADNSHLPSPSGRGAGVRVAPCAPSPASRPVNEGGSGEIPVPAASHPASSAPAASVPATSAPAADAADQSDAAAEPVQTAAAPPGPIPAPPVAAKTPCAPDIPATMLKAVSDALARRYEKLSYQLTMHGIPVGSAELESKNELGVTSITLSMRSSAAFSGIFPVNDVVETRHVGGRYIMTRISQREGSFESEENFTINLRKRSVSWFDLKRPRSVTTTVPTDNVLDSLSGIYYLRSRPLQVGKTETLYIYDSEMFAEVPVEILRREEMSLPNLKRVATVVVRPLQKSAGIFRRTGELLIWITDDDAKVPVKIETAIALGKVTARLVSAESRSYPYR